MDLSYDPDAPPARKPRPIASSPFMASTGAYPVPGLRAPPPPQTPGLGANMVPTPMGWLTPGMAGHMLNNLAPNREALSALLGMPMDGVAWAARQLGAKGIQGDMGQADPIVQVIDNITRPGAPSRQQWKPGPDVPLSSANILRLLDQYIPKGGFF